jgi:hypothetical protein
MVQAVCDWDRPNSEIMSAFYDFCCDRIVDESFTANPFALLSAILGKFHPRIRGKRRQKLDFQAHATRRTPFTGARNQFRRGRPRSDKPVTVLGQPESPPEVPPDLGGRQ